MLNLAIHVGKELSRLTMFLAVALLLCAFLSTTSFFDATWSKHASYQVLIQISVQALAIFSAGATGHFLTRNLKTEEDPRASLLVVSSIWVALILWGALPLWLNAELSFVDAVFESTSGFTTTGASILTSIPTQLSAPLQLWRVLMQWMGGLGFVVLFVALFPNAGGDARRLVVAETPGPRQRQNDSRVKDTVKMVSLIYVTLTSACVLAYALAGMSIFDALAHGFATLSTGGFSPQSNSIASFNSASIEIIAVVFMGLGALNFLLFAKVFSQGPRVFWDDREARIFILVVLMSTLLMTINLSWVRYPDFLTSLRYASFQVVSIITTTGFASADYETYPGFSQVILGLLFCIGGCTGSTAGGLKVLRVMMIGKVIASEVRLAFRPSLVKPVRINDNVIEERLIRTTLTLAVLFGVTVLVGGFFVSLFDDLDILTSISASLACVANVGPGFGLVGPTEHFGIFSDLSKTILMLCMLLGRLEFFALLALCAPTFWRR